MIDIPLRCGWRIVGTTERPHGIRVMNGDDVVDGVMCVDIHIDPHGFPQIQVALSPTKQSDTSSASSVVAPATGAAAAFTPGPACGSPKACLARGECCYDDREPKDRPCRKGMQKCDNRFAHKAHDNCPGSSYDRT